MKIFTLISALVISAASMAAHQGEIAILSGTGEAFYVMVDGNYQNYQPQSNVSMKMWTNNLHNVKIYAANNHFTFDQNMVAKPDTRMVYKIVRQYGSYQLVFVQESPMYGYTPPVNNYPPSQQGNCHPGNSYPSGGYYGNNNGNSHPGGGYTGNYNGQGQYYGGAKVLSPAEFDNLKRAVENETFSDDKLRVARVAAQSKNMRVSQIKEIARLFTFSSEQLAFTKLAYANCVDKQNYYEVMEVFTFSSDKRALEEFINAQ